MENNIYYKKLQTKKTKDLELMFRHPSMYEPLALDAAKFIIEERLAGSASEPVTIKFNSKRPNKDNPAKKVFQTRFLRSFSFRDIYTAITVALVLTALMHILNFYADEDWLENKWYANNNIYIFLTIPVIHILYKKEHGRSNDFIGRCLHVLIFIFALYSIRQIYSLTFSSQFHFVLGDIPFYLIPLLLMVLVIFLELPSTLLRFILTLFKWRIW